MQTTGLSCLAVVWLCAMGCVKSAPVSGVCVSDCQGLDDGDYQSCQGCGFYLSCANGVSSDGRPCPAGLVWDDLGKRCDWQSTTCEETQAETAAILSDVPAGGCVSDCSALSDGDYPSCEGCRYYTTCSNGAFYTRLCPADLIWHDGTKTCTYQWAPCEEDRTEAPSVLTITCDNVVDSLYVDGQLTPVDNAADWRQVGHVTIPARTRVLAVSCTDKGVVPGIMAITSNGLVTDAGWKCTDQLEEGWMALDFDDSHWSNAAIVGENGDSPWNVVLPDMGEAAWVWTATKSAKSYCRIH